MMNLVNVAGILFLCVHEQLQFHEQDSWTSGWQFHERLFVVKGCSWIVYEQI